MKHSFAQPSWQERENQRIRPNRLVVMLQNWHHLLFVHWQIPPSQLRPLVPAALDVDTFEDRAYVGLIPFTITGSRPPFAPALGPLSAFHEVNVRTYVHVRGRDPGVWFFSLDAANLVAVFAARAVYKLPYYFARIQMQLNEARVPGGVDRVQHGIESSETVFIDYKSDRRTGPRPAGCAIRYRTGGDASVASPGTLEHFLVERYVLYASKRGHLFQARVHHRPYRLQPADVLSLEDTLVAAAGVLPPGTEPLVQYSKGVRVEIFSPERLGGSAI